MSHLEFKPGISKGFIKDLISSHLITEMACKVYEPLNCVIANPEMLIYQMSETEWWASDSPGTMLKFVISNELTSKRQITQFATYLAHSVEVTSDVLEARLLRDVVGNPFHGVFVERKVPRGRVNAVLFSRTIRPTRHSLFKRSWFTPDVLAVANGIYTDEKFVEMPILADALDEAGCDIQEILEHCRSECAYHPHIRGCWVLDLVLEMRGFNVQ